MRPRLRIFNGEDDGALAVESPRVSISFGELSRIVAEARWSDRTWLSDFEDDVIDLPEDLYDVLTAYRRLRPGA